MAAQRETSPVSDQWKMITCTELPAAAIDQLLS